MVELRQPGAGLFGRAQDLLALGSALLRTETRATAEVVHPTTLRAMRQLRTRGLPRLDANESRPKQDWGLTWMAPHSIEGLVEHNLYGHGGWSGVQWWIYPELDACFVLMTNLVEPASRGADLNQLHNAFVSKTPGVSTCREVESCPRYTEC